MNKQWHYNHIRILIHLKEDLIRVSPVGIRIGYDENICLELKKAGFVSTTPNDRSFCLTQLGEAAVLQIEEAFINYCQAIGVARETNDN